MKFGIGYKIGLFLVLLIALAAFVVPRVLFLFSQDVLVRHKIVDLKDEVNVLARDLETKIRRFRERLLGDSMALSIAMDSMAGDGDERVDVGSDTWNTALRKFLARDEDYLQVQIVAVEDSGAVQTIAAASRPGVLGLSPYGREYDEVVNELAGQQEHNGAALSQVGKATVRYQNSAGRGQSVPILWAGAPLYGRVDLPDASSTARVLLIAALNLGPQLDAIDDSPRHLSFVSDHRGRFLVHADWSKSLLGSNGDPYTLENDATFDEPHLFRRAERTFLQPGDDQERRSLERRGWRWHPAESPGGDETRWLGLYEGLLWLLFGIESPPWLGVTTDVWYQQSRLLSEDTARHEELRGQVRKILRDLQEEMRQSENSLVRIECFTPEVPRIRIRAASREQLDHVTKQIKQQVEQRLDPTLRAVLDEDPRWGGRWETPVPCRRYAMHFAQVTLTSGVDARPADRFLVAQGVSPDVLESEFQVEMRKMVFVYLLIAGMAAILAFPFSLILVRPLRRITAAAEALARLDFRTDSWTHSISKTAASLPVQRRDEMGVLARTFAQMMEEIRRGSQELRDERNRLDQRVRERTAELQRANSELAVTRDIALEANRAKSVFLAQMSHELRTPLNAIIGYSELLIEEAEEEGAPTSLPDLHKIIGAGKHLLGLINDILDLSKIEAGRMELFLEEIDVRQLADAVLVTIEPLARKNANSLQLDCPDNIGSMYSDSTRLRQVLLNLCSNACKFTERGHVTLTVRRRQRAGVEGVVFRVQDTGVGMTPKQMRKLFQSFSQANESAARRYGGTGLGLVISKRLCELMGGGIMVESEAGNGSTFTAWLPLYLEESSSSASIVLRAAEPREKSVEAVAATSRDERPDDSSRIDMRLSKTGTALVIDDDASSRDLMRRHLERGGFEVTTASSGAEGLNAARLIRPTFIALDVLMPHMDGWAVLSELKSDPDLCDIPVVMVSIVDNQDLGFALGASDYLVKPIDRARLTSLIEKYQRNNSERVVLIIEDDRASRDLLRHAFTAAGWTVNEAENGRDALRQLEHQRPAFILLDLMMPEMDGFEFLDELGNHSAWHSIPIVVTTAKELTYEERARLSGKVKQILQKGTFNSRDLLNKVQQMVHAG